jgi:hypothetical protein
MTSRAADLIRGIDSANLAARRSEIRKLPLSDRRAAGDAAGRAHRAAVNAFAALNGWQATKCAWALPMGATGANGRRRPRPFARRRMGKPN